MQVEFTVFYWVVDFQDLDNCTLNTGCSLNTGPLNTGLSV